MVTLEELLALAENLYVSMENDRYTLFGLLARKKKASALTHKNTGSESKHEPVEETLVAFIKKLSRHEDVNENNAKLKNLVDILLICAQVEELDISPLAAHIALEKIATAMQTSLTVSLFAADFLEKYNEFVAQSKLFIEERAEAQLEKQKSFKKEVATTTSTKSAAITAMPLLNTPKTATSEMIMCFQDIDSRSLTPVEPDKGITAVELIDDAAPTLNSKLAALQSELDEMTQAYEKAVLSYAKFVKENQELKKSLQTFEKSHEDDEILAQKWVKMSDELHTLKTQHQPLLNQSQLTQKELLLTQSLFQKTKEELKITKELLRMESATLQAQRHNNEKFSAKITELSETNEKLARENTRLTQRIKFLESQMKSATASGYHLPLFGKAANTTAHDESTSSHGSNLNQNFARK